MAFIRDYANEHSGDPFPTFTRAGRFVKHPVRTRVLDLRTMKQFPRFSRVQAVAGDPFSFKLPKFVRKITLKKVVSGVGKLAKVALPIAATVFTGGLAGAALGLGSRLLGGGGAAEAPAPPEDATLIQAPSQGTVGEMQAHEQIAMQAYEPEDEDYEDEGYEDEDYEDEDYEDEGYY